MFLNCNKVWEIRNFRLRCVMPGGHIAIFESVGALGRQLEEPKAIAAAKTEHNIHTYYICAQ